MTVTCPTCNASLTIPDDRLPKGQVVSAACPKCKGKIVIDLTGSAPGPPTTGAAPAAAPAASASAPDETQPGGYEEESQPRALVCVAPPAERDQVLTILKREGYVAQIAKDTADAKEHLQFTSYALVVLRDGFGTEAGDGNPVLDYMAELVMGRRRNTHVVFVGPNVRSHDAPTAFAYSVNLVMNVNDLPHLAEALKRSRAEADHMYRVLVESLRAVGKG
jgi:hypothetical protein